MKYKYNKRVNKWLPLKILGFILFYIGLFITCLLLVFGIFWASAYFGTRMPVNGVREPVVRSESLTIGATVEQFTVEGIPINLEAKQMQYLLQPTKSGESLQYGEDPTKYLHL